METINYDTLRCIMSFLFSREITNLLNTCKQFQTLYVSDYKTDTGEMDLSRKTIDFFNGSHYRFYRINWINLDRLDRFNRKRCWKCGSIFISRNKLFSHLKRTNHFVCMSELDIQLERGDFFFITRYRIPCLYDSKCIDGTCNCKSKKFIYDDIRKKGVVTFTTEYGKLTMRNLESFQQCYLSRHNKFFYILKDKYYMKMPGIINSGKHWWIRPPSLSTLYLISVRDIN